MQISENRVLRCILQAPTYAPIAAMQGEIGITDKIRIIRLKLQYYRSIQQETKRILTDILNNVARRDDIWFKEIIKYFQWLNIDENYLKIISKEKLNKIISEKAIIEWKNEIDNKSTLKIYGRNLNSICIPKMYDNRPASVIWFRARSNCLMLIAQ